MEQVLAEIVEQPDRPPVSPGSISTAPPGKYGCGGVRGAPAGPRTATTRCTQRTAGHPASAVARSRPRPAPPGRGCARTRPTRHRRRDAQRHARAPDARALYLRSDQASADGQSKSSHTATSFHATDRTRPTPANSAPCPRQPGRSRSLATSDRPPSRRRPLVPARPRAHRPRHLASDRNPQRDRPSFPPSQQLPAQPGQ